MPDRLRTTLKFNAYGTLNQAGFAYANVRLTPTFAYDIDPSLGSTAMPGFTELAGIYRKYRVNSFKHQCHFSNRESFAVGAYLIPVNVDPTANVATFQKFLSNSSCVKTILGPLTGHSTAELTIKADVGHYGGSANTVMEDSYSALTAGAAAPANNIFVAIGIWVINGGALVGGVDTANDIEINIDFYELATPST